MDDHAEDRSERIEQIFQRVEQETERRARAQAQAEADGWTPVGVASVVSESVVPVIAVSPPASTPAPATQAARERRRGSVSVSRFGQATAPDVSVSAESALACKPPDTPTAVSFVVRKPTFYTAQAHGSADSLASATETPAQHRGVNDDGDDDEEQVVQMATIAGRQSISKAFTRRLSRSRTATRSRDVLDALVIGVSVEEATVEHEHDEEEAGGSRPGTSMAYAQGALKARGSRGNMSAGAEKEKEKEKGEKGGWIGRARGLTQKIRRRSMVALAQSSNSSSSR